MGARMRNNFLRVVLTFAGISAVIVASGPIGAEREASVCPNGGNIGAKRALEIAVAHVSIETWPGIEVKVRRMENDVWNITFFRIPDQPDVVRSIGLNSCGSLIWKD